MQIVKFLIQETYIFRNSVQVSNCMRYFQRQSSFFLFISWRCILARASNLSPRCFVRKCVSCSRIKIGRVPTLRYVAQSRKSAHVEDGLNFTPRISYILYIACHRVVSHAKSFRMYTYDVRAPPAASVLRVASERDSAHSYSKNV